MTAPTLIVSGSSTAGPAVVSVLGAAVVSVLGAAVVSVPPAAVVVVSSSPQAAANTAKLSTSRPKSTNRSEVRFVGAKSGLFNPFLIPTPKAKGTKSH
jgi:hypothetical protein